MRKNNSSWSQIKITASSELDLISNFLFELGAQAVEECKNARITYVLTSEKDTWLNHIHNFLSNLQNKGSVEVTELEDRNWAEEYKKFYKAQRLSRTFFLKPAWDHETPIPEESFPIVLDPGQAFGTGLHASTRLSLGLLERNLSFFPMADKIRVLDLGTGTGILAIGAYHFGVRQIEAYDNDPLAVEVANENFAQNKCKITAKVGELASAGQFDILLSNILLETHESLKEEYAKHIPKGGKLILAGVLGDQYARLKQIFAPLPFKEEIRVFLQEWVAVSYVRV